MTFGSPGPHVALPLPLNAKSEFRSPKEARIPKSEGANFGRAALFGLRVLDFLSDFGLRNSDFRFRGSTREDSIGRNLSPEWGEGRGKGRGEGRGGSFGPTCTKTKCAEHQRNSSVASCFLASGFYSALVCKMIVSEPAVPCAWDIQAA